MSTFGRGLRAEHKRVDGLSSGSFTTVISVPALANYYIYLSRVQATGGNTIRKFEQELNLGGGGGITTASTDLVIDNAEDWEDYLISSAATGTRIIKPGDSIQVLGNGINTYYAIWYQEIYFGGQANY